MNDLITKCVAKEEKLKREKNESAHLVALGKLKIRRELKRLESPTSTVIRKERISRRVGVRSRIMEMEMLRTQTLSAITATKRVIRGLIALSLRLC